MSPKTVLAIDPGHAKCGMAVACRKEDGTIELLWRAIAPTEQLENKVREAESAHPYSMVIIGSGTTSKEVVDRLRKLHPSIGILVVDERDTTLLARERYWFENPRRGLRRLLPATLQVPPEPVDDYVALILSERVLKE